MQDRRTTFDQIGHCGEWEGKKESKTIGRTFIEVLEATDVSDAMNGNSGTPVNAVGNSMKRNFVQQRSLPSITTPSLTFFATFYCYYFPNTSPPLSVLLPVDTERFLPEIQPILSLIHLLKQSINYEMCRTRQRTAADLGTTAGALE